MRWKPPPEDHLPELPTTTPGRRPGDKPGVHAGAPGDAVFTSRELPPRRLTLADRTALASRSRTSPWSGITLSVAAHVLVFGGALLWATFAPTRVVPEKPIVAKLVRLGTPRDERLLPRLPSPPKAEPPPRRPPPDPPPVTPPAPVAAPTPPTPPAPPAQPVQAKAAAPIDPPLKKEEAKQAPPSPPPAPRVDADAERRRRMAEALKGIAAAPEPGPHGTTDEPPVGREDGDPLGTADDAAEGDRYIALVVQSLKSNYVVPAVISQRERMYLSCKLRLVIARNGRIASWKIEESSGNEHFDRAVETSIQRTTFPPPPPAFLSAYGRDGIGFEFKP